MIDARHLSGFDAFRSYDWTFITSTAAGVRTFPDPPCVLPADPGDCIVPAMSQRVEAGAFSRANGFAHRI